MMLMGGAGSEKTFSHWQISCYGESHRLGKCAVFRTDLQKFVGHIQTSRLLDITDQVTCKGSLLPKKDH